MLSVVLSSCASIITYFIVDENFSQVDFRENLWQLFVEFGHSGRQVYNRMPMSRQIVF